MLGVTRPVRHALGPTMRQVWQRVKEGLTPADVMNVPRERVLYKFGGSDALAEWKITTDEHLGGKSTASLEVDEEKAVLSGRLSLESTTGLVRSGLCNLRFTPILPLNLDDFDTFAMRFKTDGRLYAVTIGTASLLPQPNVWQAPLPFDPEAVGKWCVMHVPFSSFVLTYQGYVEERQMHFNNSKVRTLGITLADNQEGDFRLELDWMRALRTD